MQAIHTKVLPATDTKGARIKAYTQYHSAIIPVNYSLNTLVAVHFEAVKALKEKHKLDWDLGDMRYGTSADGRGYTFCFDRSCIGE